MKKLAASSKQLAVKRIFLTFCLLLTAYCSLNCGSVPNLEPPECTDSRLVVKEFYSYHFGNEMKFSAENLKKREKFLTPEFFKSLQSLQTENDVFTTNTTDSPKAFRVGGCKVVEPAAKTNLEVLLFWKDDKRTEQKAINVEVVKQGDKWLVNKILN
ncbi:MAG TPA: hypothetical protein VNB22_14895 [Pyrinomonadaceae bacterium]|nr:hypothetical protein [Pyrinomonadaceae bacterium]